MGRTEMKILIGLHRNVNALDKKTSKIAAEYNLTFSQFMVLEALYSKGDMRRGKGKNLKQCRNDTSYSEQFSKNELCRKNV